MAEFFEITITVWPRLPQRFRPSGSGRIVMWWRNSTGLVAGHRPVRPANRPITIPQTGKTEQFDCPALEQSKRVFVTHWFNSTNGVVVGRQQKQREHKSRHNDVRNANPIQKKTHVWRQQRKPAGATQNKQKHIRTNKRRHTEARGSNSDVTTGQADREKARAFSLGAASRIKATHEQDETSNRKKKLRRRQRHHHAVSAGTPPVFLPFSTPQPP